MAKPELKVAKKELKQRFFRKERKAEMEVVGWKEIQPVKFADIKLLAKGNDLVMMEKSE